jgi:hypothetical protein
MSTIWMPDGTTISTEGTFHVTLPNGMEMQVDGNVSIPAPEESLPSEADEPLLSFEEAEDELVWYLAHEAWQNELPNMFFHCWGNDHYEIVAFGTTEVSYGEGVPTDFHVCTLIDCRYVSHEVAMALHWVYGIDFDQ